MHKPVSSTFGSSQRNLFLVALFLVVFVIVRLVVRPINNTDYLVFQRALDSLSSGHSPYAEWQFISLPWSAWLMLPLHYQPLETWLALEVAIFVVVMLDLGSPLSLLMLIHPIFIVLIASANPEWLMVGPGLWLLYRYPRGWTRGLAWVLLSGKPQAVAFLLVFDGIQALRERDWKAIVVMGSVAVAGFLAYPEFFKNVQTGFGYWSMTTIAHFGVSGAALATAVILALRWRRRADLRTLCLLLAPIWVPYMLQYSYMTLLFVMRGASFLRILVFTIGSLAIVAIFWKDFHVSEHLGTLGMVLLAALLAPAYSAVKRAT
jgi:hypothetical protein